MGAIKNLRLAALAVLSALVVPAAFVAACSSDNNSNPAPVVTFDANTASPDSSTTTEEPDATTGSDGAVSPVEDASTDVREEPIVPEDAQACTASHAPAQGASADAGCWSCAPQSAAEYLNQCATTGVLCVKFDNSRVPGYDGGAPAPLN
jgi:hypothetical protein